VCERDRWSSWLWPARSHSAAVTQAGPARCKLHATRGGAQHTQHSSTYSSQHSVLALLRCLFACSTRAGAAASAGPFATAHVAAGLLLEGCIECARGVWGGGLARGRGAAAGVGHRGAPRSFCPDWPVGWRQAPQSPQSLDAHELGRMEIRRMPLIVVAVAVLAALAPCSAQNTPCALLRGALARSLNPQP
jgi:hypothetical protein